MEVHIDAGRHRCSHVIDGKGLANACRVVIDQVFLEFLHLLVIEDNLGKLSYAGVDPVHNLADRDLLFQHVPAFPDALQPLRVELHFFAETGYFYHILDGEVISCHHYSHSNPPVEMVIFFQQILKYYIMDRRFVQFMIFLMVPGKMLFPRESHCIECRGVGE